MSRRASFALVDRLLYNRIRIRPIVYPGAFSRVMSGISTHVLNLVTGLPARGLPVLLEFQAMPRAWRPIAEDRTDEDGRIAHLLPKGFRLQSGAYRLTFDVAAYFRSQSVASFYPEISIAFVIRDAIQHHHIPLLLGPFGYTTYRGS